MRDPGVILPTPAARDSSVESTMVVASLALSLVMIFGGIAAVVQGFPYVRLESGLAMVIGGSTAASAGVILLGLTAILDRLRKLQAGLSDSLARVGAGTLQPMVPVSPAAPWEGPGVPVPSVPAPEVAPPERPSLAGMAAGMGAAGLAGLSLGALRPGGRGAEPVFEDPAHPEPPHAEPQANAAEPLLPDLLPEPAPLVSAPAFEAEHGAGPLEHDLFAASERRPPVFSEPEPIAATTLPRDERIGPEFLAPEPIGLRPSLDESEPETAALPAAEPVFVEPLSVEPPAPEPAAPAAEVTPEADAEERHAVGSYSSGANTYVMFSDGSIEADTPRGRFTFASLDELKSFVNAGGEEARGAA